MDINTYQIIITNKISITQDKNLIIQKLAALFKITEQKAAQFLSNPTTVVKNNIDKETAEKYLTAISKTGAECKIINNAKEGHIVRENKNPQLVALDNSHKEYTCPKCGSRKDFYTDVCLDCGFDQFGQNNMKNGKLKKFIRQASILIGLIAVIVIAYPFALPFYNSITVKYRIANGLELAFDTRDKITRSILDTNFWPNQNIDANLPKDISNEIIESIVVGENAVTTITLRAEPIKADSSKTIIFKPALLKGKLVWNCTQGTLENEHRPDICRQINH